MSTVVGKAFESGNFVGIMASVATEYDFLDIDKEEYAKLAGVCLNKCKT